MNLHPYASNNNMHHELEHGHLLSTELPSHLLHPESAQLQHLLEELDDVIFLAIKGQPDAMHQAHILWPKVLRQVGWNLVEESREQYLRFANDIYRELDREGAGSPERSIAVLEIIELLTGDK